MVLHKRQADRMTQQNTVHDSSREPTMMSPSPMNMQSQQFMTPPAGQFPSQQSMAAQVDPGMAQQMLNHMMNGGANFHQ